jgi:16S rRNA (cytosine1402-N4)-methyltransferase
MSGPSAEKQLALPGLTSELGDFQGEWVLMDDGETTHEEELEFQHVTVMKAEVIEAVALRLEAEGRDEAVVVDATLGGGGHAEALLHRLPKARLIAFDRDQNACAAATARLETFGTRLHAVCRPFSELEETLAAMHAGSIDALYADLGVSSPQLDERERGMSFRREGPLDMRMDQSQGETAAEMISRLEENELADVIYKFGDERRSRRIARSIKRADLNGELRTTLDLRKAIVRAIGPVRVGGVDPATRTFQALRIAVNNELGELEALLDQIVRVVRPGGVCAIISFHSLEDRLVKNAFKNNEVWTLPQRKPSLPTLAEREENLRARSAKLRVAHRNVS